MTDELLEYENVITGRHGDTWVARVLGAERPDGTWVGWIRFGQVAGEHLLETERETTQPNRDDLMYWAKGLTYTYLEGALERARREAGQPPEHGPADLGAGGPTRPPPEETGPRIRVTGAPEPVIKEVLGATELRRGAIREVSGAGVVIYEGPGEAGDHYFALRFGSRNTGAVLSNWLWSRLHGTGASVHVNGQQVELTQDALSHAIVGE